MSHSGSNMTILSPDRYDDWDAWLQTVDSSTVRQSSFYTRALDLYGHRAEILACEGGVAFTAAALLAIRDPGVGVGPFVRTSGGIALADPADPTTLESFLGALLERASELRASVVEISLQIPRQIGGSPVAYAEPLQAVLRNAGFDFASPLGTYFVDLTADSEDELLKGFGKNPRRHIRKAIREGLVVERTDSPEDHEAFGAAHRGMVGRKGLEVLPEEFAREVLLPLSRAGLGDLYVARYSDVPRNYLYVGATGNPIYHWGALLDAAREKGCPQTGQFLHYTAMCRYRSLGKRIYNFGGSPGPEPEPEHPNFTVWKFKHEFAGDYVHMIGSWQKTLRPVSKAVLDLMRQAMTLKRRLLR